MPLTPGTQLGRYEIQSALGVGGMGEVYLAHDRTLDRQVAIKVLPAEVTRDPERIARFQREARLLASLNHPSIASIHGFDEHEGIRFLVMEHVEGVTLDDKLKTDGLEVEDALDVARQMAEGLEAAHDKGIVHRDLKPGNVMIRPDGCVKILDFGLAKAMEEESRSSTPDAATITAAYTQPGVVLGTAAYMSPEQARGRILDKRTDIWSFGVILFECLTGQPLFRGATAQDSMGAIMHREPEWSALPPNTPLTVQLLLRRCLIKDRRRRLQAIGDARIELDDSRRDQQWLTAAMPTHASRRAAVFGPWMLCVVLLALVVIVGLRPAVEPAQSRGRAVHKSVITLHPGAHINWRGTKDTWSKMGYSQLLELSRDGRRIIFTVQEDQRTSLYLKDDDEFLPRMVQGTDGARGPFLSPDGLWIGFLTEKSLYKVRLPGGAPQPVCEFNSTAFDATWLDDGTIVFSTDLGLRSVSSDGGPVKSLTSIDVDNGIRGHHFPHIIAGTRLVTFTVAAEDGQHAAVLSLDDGTWDIVKQHASDARYVSSGYLVFARNGELLVASFDPSDPKAVGTDLPIVQGVQQTPGLGGAVVHLFDTSDSGTLIFAPMVDPPDPDALLWVDFEGNEEVIVQGDGHWMHQRVSPDGEHILFNSMTADGMLDLYIYDIKRDQTNRLTRNGNTYDAEWSPDGQSVGFAALDTHGRSVYLVPSDFSGSARKLIDGSDARPHFSQWSHDSDTLVFFDRSKRGGVWTISPKKGDTMQELMNSELGEGWAMISPDGHIIAYVGFESGDRDVYIQPYPALGPRIRVSRDGGGEPRWGPDSRTLFYREDGTIFKASIVLEPNLDVPSVTPLPIKDSYDCAASGHQHFDLSRDGTRFLMVKHGHRSYPTSVHVLRSWSANLNSISKR